MVSATPRLHDWLQRHACWFWVVSRLSEPRCFSLSYFITVLFACEVGCLVFFRLPEGSPLVSQNQNLATAQYLVTNYFFLIGLLSPAQLSSTSGLIGMEFVGLFLKLKVNFVWGVDAYRPLSAALRPDQNMKNHIYRRGIEVLGIWLCSCHFNFNFFICVCVRLIFIVLFEICLYTL